MFYFQYEYSFIYFVVIQLLSHVRLFVTPWTAACQASLSFTISLRLQNLMSIEPVVPSTHFIFSHPLLLCSIFQMILKHVSKFLNMACFYLALFMFLLLLLFNFNLIAFCLENKIAMLLSLP